MGGARGWSARRIRGTAVEPECPRLYRAGLEQTGRCPGILGQARCDVVFIRGLDDVQGLLAVADRAAEDDKTVFDEPIHERRVLIPAVLVADLARGVPAWAVDQPHREIGHVRSVLAGTDSYAGARSASTSLDSSISSRKMPGRSGWPGSPTQRAKATLKTATPVSAARLAVGSGTPRSRSAPATAAANAASLVSSRSRSSAFADTMASRSLTRSGFSCNMEPAASNAAPTASMAVAEAGAAATARTRRSRIISMP